MGCEIDVKCRFPAKNDTIEIRARAKGEKNERQSDASRAPVSLGTPRCNKGSKDVDPKERPHHM